MVVVGAVVKVLDLFENDVDGLGKFEEYDTIGIEELRIEL